MRVASGSRAFLTAGVDRYTRADRRAATWPGRARRPDRHPRPLRLASVTTHRTRAYGLVTAARRGEGISQSQRPVRSLRRRVGPASWRSCRRGRPGAPLVNRRALRRRLRQQARNVESRKHSHGTPRELVDDNEMPHMLRDHHVHGAINALRRRYGRILRHCGPTGRASTEVLAGVSHNVSSDTIAPGLSGPDRVHLGRRRNEHAPRPSCVPPCAAVRRGSTRESPGAWRRAQEPRSNSPCAARYRSKTVASKRSKTVASKRWNGCMQPTRYPGAAAPPPPFGRRGPGSCLFRVTEVALLGQKGSSGRVTVVWGERDLLVPPSHVDAVQRALPQARIEVRRHGPSPATRAAGSALRPHRRRLLGHHRVAG